MGQPLAKRLFGTDGIRGQANHYPLIPAVITRIGQAVASVLGSRKGAHIVIGTDTRISADMIESAIISGICSCGVNVLHSGMMPTPGIAYLTANTDSAVAGIVISASHNPFFDNGIKVFNGHGYKLSDRIETEIEGCITDKAHNGIASPGEKVGRIIRLPDADDRYLNFLQRCWPKNYRSSGLKLVIDCANGATYRIAPALFASLGIELTSIFIHPNGKNINTDCGSEHPSVLSKKVVEIGADLGVAFDGDGDRLVAVDEKGDVLTGDQLIAILAEDYKSQNHLSNNTVVSTVMSNIGLGLALNKIGIAHETSDVGDRRVMEKMRDCGAVLGGEDSGHIILLDHHTTGDGLLSAMRLLEVMVRKGCSLSDLAKIMTVAPQALINVTVSSKPDLATVKPIQEVIKEAETALKDQGRVLVRYSGTQPLCRVMVEGATDEITKRYCKEISDVIAKVLGERK